MIEPCPCGKSDLVGDPIDKEYLDKGYYGTKTHYSRVIGIYDMDVDMTVAYRCPDCGHEWDRK